MHTVLLVFLECVCKRRTDVYVPDDSVFMTFTRHKKTSRVQDVKEAEPLQETKMTWYDNQLFNIFMLLKVAFLYKVGLVWCIHIDM